MEAAPSTPNGWAVAGFVCSLLGTVAAGLVFWLVVPQFVLGIAGGGLGAWGWRAAKRGAGQGGLAVAAMVLGAIAVLSIPLAQLFYRAITGDWGY